MVWKICGAMQRPPAFLSLSNELSSSKSVLPYIQAPPN